MCVAVKDTSITLDGQVFFYGVFISRYVIPACLPHLQGSVGLVVEVHISDSDFSWKYMHICLRVLGTELTATVSVT